MNKRTPEELEQAARDAEEWLDSLESEPQRAIRSAKSDSEELLMLREEVRRLRKQTILLIRQLSEARNRR